MNAIIPPTLTSLASSKKAISFYLILGLFFMRGEIGMNIEWFKWVVIAFVGYVVAQGLSDFGKGHMVNGNNKGGESS